MSARVIALVLIASCAVGACGGEPPYAEHVPALRLLRVEQPPDRTQTSGWIYIDSQLVAVLADGAILSTGALEELTPPRASAARSEALDIYLPAGRYVVEYLTFGRGYDGFPLVTMRAYIDMTSPGSEVVRLTNPLDDRRAPRSAFPLGETSRACRVSTDSALYEMVRASSARAGELSQDPIALALAEAAHMMGQDLAYRPAVFVSLPPEYGGPRDLDARQVELIIDFLALRHHGVALDELQRCAAAAPRAAAALEHIAAGPDAVGRELASLVLLPSRLRAAPLL